MKELSNVELLLLEIIEENSEMSGYGINRYIEERGYRTWAGIGLTSIYAGLEKLKKKELVFAYLETKKTGKGPFPNKFRITVKGRALLKECVKSALSESRELDRAFGLGLAGIPSLTNEEVVECLLKRVDFLDGNHQKIKTKFKQQKKESLPIIVSFPFDHALYLLEKEKEFTKNLVAQIKKEESP